MFNRNILVINYPYYFGRPVTTYGVTFPNIDCVKSSSVNHVNFPVYCQKSVFNQKGAPYNGFAKNVDVESALHNSFMPLQKLLKVSIYLHPLVICIMLNT